LKRKCRVWSDKIASVEGEEDKIAVENRIYLSWLREAFGEADEE
jgi:hypothetical protein